MGKAKMGGSDKSAAMVGAWSYGATSESSDSHKAIGQSGYKSGLSDGMRYVVTMMEAGVEWQTILEECRSRITPITAKPADGMAAWWIAKASQQGTESSETDHEARFAAQHLDAGQSVAPVVDMPTATEVWRI